jgi:hypothetical protein
MAIDDARLDSMLEKFARLPGGDTDPFSQSVGPTAQCLSSIQRVTFVAGGETDPKIIEHLKACKWCRRITENYKKISEK